MSCLDWFLDFTRTILIAYFRFQNSNTILDCSKCFFRISRAHWPVFNHNGQSCNFNFFPPKGREGKMILQEIHPLIVLSIFISVFTTCILDFAYGLSISIKLYIYIIQSRSGKSAIRNPAMHTTHFTSMKYSQSSRYLSTFNLPTFSLPNTHAFVKHAWIRLTPVLVYSALPFLNLWLFTSRCWPNVSSLYFSLMMRKRR